MTTRQTLYFARPHRVEIRTENLPDIAANQVRVDCIYSAISAGTEMLFYRGQIPAGMTADATIAGLGATVRYPLSYGYCSVGEVTAIGREVEAQWKGKRVFAFHPHTSAFVCDPVSLIVLPDHLTYEQALFLPNMETAVNFAMDGKPVIGEHVLVMGLGVVGLLTVFLLRRFPLGKLSAIDGYANRIAVARRWGIDECHTPESSGTMAESDPDLIFEVSSNPDALNSAVQLAGFGTRIVIGSWYGDKTAHLALGGSFHRNRVTLISSQVSSIEGHFSNRWTKQRRIDLAMQHLRNLPTADLISHRMPLTEAANAYHLLDQHPEQTLQVIFTY